MSVLLEFFCGRGSVVKTGLSFCASLVSHFLFLAARCFWLKDADILTAFFLLAGRYHIKCLRAKITVFHYDRVAVFKKIKNIII